VRLYHKTTRRVVYDEARASRPECDDVILWNERRELTESSIANIVLELDGRRVTPPVSAGLLAGTFRAHLLAAGEIEERTLTIDDLQRASRVWLINSVRGWQEAAVIGGDGD
jgi:para-aminobenzoate synthetase/4-amino-4-deoxychorismate lyase